MEDRPQPQEPTRPKRRDPWSLLASQLGLLSSPIAPDVAEANSHRPDTDESPQEPTIAHSEESPVVEEVPTEMQAEQTVSTSLFNDEGDELPPVLWTPKKVAPTSASKASSSKAAEIKSPFASRQQSSSDVAPPKDTETAAEVEEPIPASAFSSGVGRQNRDKRSRGREDQKERVQGPESSEKKEFRKERSPRRESYKTAEVKRDPVPEADAMDSYHEVLDEASFEPKAPERSRRRRGRKEEPVTERFEEQIPTSAFGEERPEEKPQRSRERRPEREKAAPQKTVRNENRKETTAPVPDFSQLHKKIPSWDDAIGMIIDTNMERSPNRGSSSSRKGNSRGRRR